MPDRRSTRVPTATSQLQVQRVRIRFRREFDFPAALQWDRRRDGVSNWSCITGMVSMEQSLFEARATLPRDAIGDAAIEAIGREQSTARRRLFRTARPGVL
jgi:hypothetical protein